jgi:hypothetical protein
VRSPWSPIAEWSSDISQLRYAHLRTILPLHARRVALEAEEDVDRHRREALFPATKDEWREASASLQLRVARFLAVKEKTEKERLMNESGWVWRQVERLCDEYENEVLSFFFVFEYSLSVALMGTNQILGANSECVQGRGEC